MSGKGTVNKAIIIGRLGADPKIAFTGSGTTVASFSVATNRTWKGKDGNQSERTDWINIKVFGPIAEFVSKHLKKGSLVYVSGRIETRSYDQNGVKKYITEVNADTIELLGSKQNGEQDDLPI